jgi:hypothetical protein
MPRGFGGYDSLCDLTQGQERLVLEHQDGALIATEIRLGFRVDNWVTLSLRGGELSDVFSDWRMLDYAWADDPISSVPDCNFNLLRVV